MNLYNLELSWDFDQVLMQTEIPVADFCDSDKGTHYRGRKIRGWNSFSQWLLEDGIFRTKEEADDYENKIWTDPKIIKEGLPNRKLQALSYAAFKRGIKQTITTSRISKLAIVTEGQVKLYYPWLSESVNQRLEDIPGVAGEDYKVTKVSELYMANPSLVHMDDSMTFMRKLLGKNPDISVLGFPAPEDYYADLTGGSRIFFPDISVFADMLYYSDLVSQH